MRYKEDAKRLLRHYLSLPLEKLNVPITNDMQIEMNAIVENIYAMIDAMVQDAVADLRRELSR